MTDLLEAPTAVTERRLTRSYFAATYLAHAVTTIGSIVGVVVFLNNPDVWPGQWAVVVFGVILVLRVVDPVYEWASTRIIVTSRELRVTTGLLNRRTRSIRWNAVHTVETTSPWAYRLFGLVRLRIAQGGDESAQVSLVGITAELRDEIVALCPVLDTGSDPDDVVRDVNAKSVADPAPHHTTASGQEHGRRTLVYRATTADLVVASVLFGRFAVVGLAIAFALFEQLGNFGLLADLALLEGLGAVGLAVGVAVIIVCIGIFSSVVRYARLTVHSNERGGIAVSYGLVETHERVIDSAAITGVVLQRNVLEMILGRVRLGLLTTDTSEQFGSNLLLPSLPRGTVAAILQAGFHRRVPAHSLATRRRMPLTPVLIFTAVTSAAAAAGWALMQAGLPLGLAAIAALIVWAVIVTSMRPIVTRLSYDDNHRRATLRTLFIVDRETHIEAPAIHLVTTTGLRRSAWIATVHYYAGGPHQRSSVRFTSSDLADLRSQVGDRGARTSLMRVAREESRRSAQREELA